MNVQPPHPKTPDLVPPTGTTSDTPTDTPTRPFPRHTPTRTIATPANPRKAPAMANLPDLKLDPDAAERIGARLAAAGLTDKTGDQLAAVGLPPIPLAAHAVAIPDRDRMTVTIVADIAGYEAAILELVLREHLDGPVLPTGDGTAWACRCGVVLANTRRDAFDRLAAHVAAVVVGVGVRS